MDQSQTRTLAQLTNFRWMDFDAYLFDIDGTLLVTRDLVHYNALNRAIREVYEVEATIDGIPYHGKTDLGILRAVLERAGTSADVFEARLSEALSVVCREVGANAHGITADICFSIPEVLTQLQAADKLLGIASGNLEAVGWHKLEAAGLRQFFSFGFFSDQLRSADKHFSQRCRVRAQQAGSRCHHLFHRRYAGGYKSGSRSRGTSSCRVHGHVQGIRACLSPAGCLCCVLV